MTYPILPLTPAAFTVEVLNSANNDLMRLWRLEARIDTYLSVVSPARTRPQQLQPLFVAQLPPPPPSPAPVTAVAAESTTGAPRGRGKKGVATKRVTKAAAAKLSCAAASTSSLDTVDADTSPTSASASASSLAPSSLDHMQQDVDVVEHDVDLDFDCRVETIERLPRPIAAALTLGSTPRGADMDKIKLYGILAASYLATSALYKVVQPCSSAQEYFAQRFRLSRAQLARILHAAQVILDLSAMPRDPVDLVPFPLSLDVACAVHKCAGPSRRARRALWSAVLLTSSPTGGENNDGDLDQQDERDEGEARQQRGITRRDVERAMPLVVKHGIQFYLDAASVDVNSGSVEEQHHEHDFAPSSSRAGSPLLLGSALADENQPQTSTSTSTSGRPVKGVRYRDLELSASSSSLSSSADGSLRFHPYARRASGMITSTSDKHEYVTPPDTPANALLYGADGAAPASRDKQDRPTPVLPVWKRNVPGAAAMDDAEDADHMDVDEEVAESDQQREEQTRAQEQEGVDMADVSPSSIMSPPTSPTVGTMPSDSVLFGGPSPSRLRGNSAVSIDLLVAAADFVEQQERRASVSSAATSVPPMSPTAGQFVVELESTLAAARASRGPPQYPIEFVMIPFGAAAQQQQQNLSKSSSTSGRGVSPLSLEFSMAAAKMMMPSPSPSPSPSPVHCNADDAQQAKGATPELGHLYASSLASMSSPPRSTSSSPFGVIATSSSSRSPSPVAPIAPRSALSQVAARSMPGGMLEECEA